MQIPDGVPAWRVMVGNLAAGATAGCAVEAGARGTALSQRSVAVSAAATPVMLMFKHAIWTFIARAA
jgi:hypothetical protein